jgi:hypothetical protein
MRAAVITAALLATAPGVLSVPPKSSPAANTITGRVTTPDGRPAADATITLLEKTLRDGSWSFHIVDARLSIPTDANGRYEIRDARLGEFYVVAMPRNTPRGPDGQPSRSGYGRTFYPSAKSAETATPITVTTRTPVTADITLLPAALGSVRGTAFNSRDLPAAGGRLLIAHGDHLFGVGGAAAPLQADGTFAIAGIPPGTYFLQYREGPWPPPRDEIPLVSGAKVVLDGQDLAGVRVAPIRMVRASGRVIVPDALRGDIPHSGVTVAGVPVDFEGNPGPTRPGALQDDLTFAFATWPGPHRVVISGMPYAWRVKAVRYRGQDVTKSGIDFTGPDVVSGIEVELERGVR